MDVERKPTVFVCGPFTNALEGPEEQPRLHGDLAAFLDLIHETIEQKRLKVASAHREELAGPHELTPEVIAKRDLDWMKDCTAAVIVLGTPSRPFWRTDGTFIELGWAAVLDKPVVLVGDLEAYPSALVRGLPSVLRNSVTVTPKRLAAQPELLLHALGQVATQLVTRTDEPLQGEQRGAMSRVGQP